MVKACIRIVLALFLASALLGLSSPVGAIGVPEKATGSPAIATTKGKPVAVWSLSWTSTEVGSGQEDDSYGHATDSYSYTQSGSTLYNIYAGGTSDNTNFKLHVADDADGTGTDNDDCYPKSIYETYHDHQSTTNPDKYNGSPQGKWTLDASKNGSGNWIAYLRYPSDENFKFAESDRYIYTECDGSGSDKTRILDDPWINGCFTQELHGNVDGTEFTYHGDGNYEEGGCYGPASFELSMAQETVHFTVDMTARLLNARDLTVKRLEVTQGLQDEANSIPLVQGRSTVVRAFIDIGTDPGPVDGVTGSLEGSAGGTKLGAIKPFNPNGQINAPSNPDWKKIDDTLNFELPLAWTKQPSLHLTVKVNPDHTVVESNYDNNDLSADVSPRACSGISIGYTPIHYAPPGKDASDPSANIQVAQEFMQKIYPIPDNSIVYVPRGAMILMQDINTKPNNDNLLDSLEELLNISSPPHPDHIFGWLPSLAYGGNGRGYINSNAAFGNDTEAPDMWRRTFAHEIGHNLGLDHPPKDDPLTTNGDHWFDVYDRVIKPVPSSVGGDNLLDLMVPKRLESEAWISPTNYNYLVNQLCSASAAAAVTESSLPQAGSDNLVISGSVGNTDPATGTLDPLFGPTTAPTTTLPAGSQYCVNLEDALENVLSSYCFNVSFDDDSDTPASAASFSMVVPDPTGLYRIELTKSTSSEPVVLSSQTASAHPPSVTVTYPNAAGLTLSGNQTITWTGSDLDSGSSLTYDVLYSHDKGTTWMGIGAGITGTSYAIDFSSLPGTNGANGLIEVMVSDGFYSAQDTLNNPFTVDNKPPSVSILSPFSGASFYTGTKIVLEGDGIDLQDGLLSNSALNWVSSKDGALGTGQMLEVNLSPGTHTITLKATDSQGLYATASTQLTVVQNVVLPGAFNKSSPANAATGQPNNPTLKWGTSSNATSYEYCLSTTACTAASTWTSTGTATSKALSGLTPGAKYYWQVRARNASGVTYANANLTASWSFTVTPKPGMFAKTSPANAATNQSTSPTLKWGSALAATRYDYCLGTVTCTTTSTWTSTGTATSKALSGLKSYKTYYWQVRAVNSSGSTYANGGAVWSFKTAPLSATFQSVGTYDGWVLESTAGSGIGNSLNTTAATLLLGDDKLNRQYRDILSFNTASLPDTAVITQVTLKVMQQPIVGTNPFTALGALNVDIRKPYFGTTVGLVADDFQATASKTGAGSFGAMPVSGWYTANLGSSANPYVNKSGTTQFRLRFATASNKNSVADIINLFSGNASIAADRPVLIIQYYAP